MSTSFLMRDLCERLEQGARTVFGPSAADREDARAFGASLQAALEREWPRIAKRVGGHTPVSGGPRSVYDVGAQFSDVFVGIDVTTTNVDAGRYADGGLASVDAALRFLAGANRPRQQVLVMLDVEHEGGTSGRTVVEVTALPLHVLPPTALRIENLGTGQLRLENALSELRPRADWNRTVPDFVETLTALAMDHYVRVADTANQRRDHLSRFASQGHVDFVSWTRRRG